LTAHEVLNSEKKTLPREVSYYFGRFVGLSVSPSVINSISDMINYLLVGSFNKYNKIHNMTLTFLAVCFNIIIPPKTYSAKQHI
jgi:hypothetical protein